MTNGELITLIQDYGMAMWAEGVVTEREKVRSRHAKSEELFEQIKTAVAER
jgi:hypothetical protein